MISMIIYQILAYLAGFVNFALSCIFAWSAKPSAFLSIVYSSILVLLSLLSYVNNFN